MLKINELNRIHLGVQGENDARTIEIDVTEWMKSYPAGTVSVWNKRNGETINYTPTGIEYDADEKILSWTPSGVDTFYAGAGWCGIILTENGVVKKSRNIETFVTASESDIPGSDANAFDYNRASNKPKLNGVEIQGEKDLKTLGAFDDTNMSSTTKTMSAAKIKEELDKKIDKANIENDLTGTAEGKVLDARQGKILKDQVDGKIDKPFGVTAGKFLQTDNDGKEIWGNPADAAVIAQYVASWLSEHTSGGETLVADDTFTIPGAAAESVAVGALKSALNSSLGYLAYINYACDLWIANDKSVSLNSETSKSTLIPVSNGQKIYTKYNGTNTIRFVFLKSAPVSGSTASLSDTYNDIVYNNSESGVEYTIPADTNYLWIGDVNRLGSLQSPDILKIDGIDIKITLDETIIQIYEKIEQNKSALQTDIQDIVENGVGFATNAQKAVIAENAGFEWFFASEDVDFNRTAVETVFSDYVEFTRTDQAFSINVSAFSISRDSSLVCYAFGLWDIEDLVGKGKHIILDFTNSGYVSSGASYYINKLLLTKGYDYGSANILYTFNTDSLQSKISRIEFDLDTLADFSGEDHVRLLIGFSHTISSSGGTVTGRGATTISVKAQMITGEVYAKHLLGFDPNDYYTKTQSDNRYAQKPSWYYGKKICTFGDSLTGNGHFASDEVNTGYWQPLLHDYLGATVINVGVGGTTVFNNGQGSTQNGYNLTQSWMCSDERINMIPQDSDVIIFWGGHNDAYSIHPFSDLTIGQETPDDTLFTGAYQICLSKMVARCPNALIICVTPHVARTDENSNENTEFVGGNGRTMNNCAKLVVDICHYYGFPVIDMRDSGLSVLNHAKYFADVIHVNSTDGAEMVAMAMINGLKRFEPIEF